MPISFSFITLALKYSRPIDANVKFLVMGSNSVTLIKSFRNSITAIISTRTSIRQYLINSLRILYFCLVCAKCRLYSQCHFSQAFAAFGLIVFKLKCFKRGIDPMYGWALGWFNS